MARWSGLGSSVDLLCRAYDVAMLDLDGVVYIGPNAVEGAAEHLSLATAEGMSLAFVTNNAARTPAAVAKHLNELGIACRLDDVVTSAQAAARLVAEAVPAGSHVFVIGGEGLIEALTEHGLVPVSRIEDDPAAVVSGYHPDVLWKTVLQGSILVKRGVPWFASNLDMSVPTPYGPGPGNGVLVKAVADFTGVTPIVAGKPESPLFHETQRRVGGSRPLVVGDRLDTDIEGAVRAGYDSLLVMTGVTGLPELVGALPESRPTYVAADLGGLMTAPKAPAESGSESDSGSVAGSWQGFVDGQRLVVEGTGTLDEWWQAAATTAWSYLDRTGQVVEIQGIAPPQP